jgi:hypothetical protein
MQNPPIDPNTRHQKARTYGAREVGIERCRVEGTCAYVKSTGALALDFTISPKVHGEPYYTCSYGFGKKEIYTSYYFKL